MLYQETQDKIDRRPTSKIVTFRRIGKRIEIYLHKHNLNTLLTGTKKKFNLNIMHVHIEKSV